MWSVPGREGEGRRRREGDREGAREVNLCGVGGRKGAESGACCRRNRILGRPV